MADTNNLVLKEFTLHTQWGAVDIREHVYHFEIIENIWENTLSGIADLSDTESLVEDMAIVGDAEFVTIKWAVASGNAAATELGTKSVTLDVYKIENEKIVKNKLLSFRMRLMGQGVRRSINHRVKKFYEGTQDAIVERICSAQLGRGLFRVDPAELETKYIFPNWHPLACINYLTKNARSAATGDSDYHFFESIDGYNFLTTSFMIEEPEVESIHGREFKNRVVKTLRDHPTNFNIEAIHKKKAFDVVENMVNGMFGTNIIWHEMVNKKWREVGKTYDETFGEFAHVNSESLLFDSGGNPLNKNNKFQMIPTQPRESEGSYISEEMEDIRIKKAIRQKQVEQNLHVLEMAADPNIILGRPIKIDYRSPIDDFAEEKHIKLNDKFLITGVRHSCSRTKYKMFAEISKDTYWT